MSRQTGATAEIRVVIPSPDHAAIKELARRNDRSLTAEVLRALRAYVAKPGVAEQTLLEARRRSDSRR